VIVTQLFYDNTDFFRFRDQCESAGIRVPLIPGLLPVISLGQIQRIASLCGARLPEPFVSRLAEHDSPEWQFQVGVEQAIEQASGLLSEGIAGMHFYVLNRSDATIKILEAVNFSEQTV
jgi:methylenetetrahydrofolate reductase (NADPH)